MPKTTLQWLSLVGIIWLQSLNGTNTNFPAYSSHLKQLLHTTQLRLNYLAFASDAGKLFGFVSGIAALYLPLWLVLLIGSSLGLVGYGVQYLSVKNHVSSSSYPYFFLLTILAGNSICWINTVCYIVTIRNFPSDHRVAVGLTTSYQGLSAKLYTVLVTVFFHSPPNKRAAYYLLLNSLCPLLVCFAVSLFLREVDIGNGKTTKSGFSVMFFITIVTGIYAITSSLGSISSRFSALGSAIGILVFLLAPLVVPIVEKLREVQAKKWSLNREMKVYNFSTDIEQNNSGDHREMENIEMKGGEEHHDEEVGHVKEEIGVKLMLRRGDFWLYVLVYFSGATLGLVYLNNLGQIAESRGCLGTSSLVSVSSSFSFFGRLMPSLVDYFFSRSKYLVSRPATIAVLMAPIGGSFFLLLDPSGVSLYISTAVIGVCTGAITTLSVSTTTELFGTKNFSVNHNVVVANIPVGSLVFGHLASFIYHREGDGDGKCMGMACYRDTFIIWGSVCFLGNFLAWILFTRTRKFYLESWHST